MLSAILSHDDCKKCRLCCYLEKYEYDELMSFTYEEMMTAKNEKKVHFIEHQKFYFIDIEKENVKTNAKSYFECPYHNDECGCMLYDKKPLSCKLWPFAIMRDNNEIGIYLSKECIVLKNKTMNEINNFIMTSLYDFLYKKVKNSEIHILPKNDDYVLIKEL